MAWYMTEKGMVLAGFVSSNSNDFRGACDPGWTSVDFKSTVE